MCNVRKVAQMAAYFLHRAGGGPMDHVKLMKLMYLADRRALATYRLPISNDTYCSMKRGPVLEKTLELFEGEAVSADQAEWNSWISKKENHALRLNRELKHGDLDRLARQEMAIMGMVYDYFGAWDWKDLVDYTHLLKEWDGPGEDADKKARKHLGLDKILGALPEPSKAKPLMTPGEIASTVRYLTEIEPNIKLALSVQDFNSRKRHAPEAYAEAFEAILNAQ